MPAGGGANALRHATIVAIDWSGAVEARQQRRAICTAIARAGEVEVIAGRTRDETVEFVRSLPAPVVVGFDFSFSVPAWFARSLRCHDVGDVWQAAARLGDAWLAGPQWPFWGHSERARCDLAEERRFRDCESRLRREGRPAKSVFQLVGNGQVGRGSIRGMRGLVALRDAGFAIWPFDDAAERTALEIYPSALRRCYAGPPIAHANDHARDATESALVMWEHRCGLLSLRAATDPVTRLEGDVWLPSTGGVSRPSSP
jgi:Protein of unknown function (DUF429)